MKKVIALMFLLSFIVLPTYVCAKVRMGSRTMSVGDVEQLIVAYSHETATGSWKISEGNACRISARSTKSCQITAIRAGKCTVIWSGIIDAGFYDDYYWDITVEGGDPSGGGSGGGSQSSSDDVFYDNTVEGISMRFWLGGDNDIAIVSEECIFAADGRVTIPDYANGLPVRTIANAAFWNISGLTELVIPNTVTWVDSYITLDCDNLKTIICEAATPPQTYSSSTISDVFLSCTLYVPKGCKSKYKEATGWSEFRNIKEIGMEEKKIPIDATNFPDENFRKCLLEQNYGKDGVITEEELAAITFIDISHGFGGSQVENLKGIEHFISIEALDCSWNNLSSLDLSNNKSLKRLYCENNKLTSLDLSNNTELMDLACYSNQIYGEKMDALISSLSYSKDNHKLYIVSNSFEGNVCTTTQVAAAKAKGWIPYYKNGNSWEEYAGSDPTAIEIIPEASTSSAPIFNLDGQRLDKPCRGINIIDGKKVIVK